METIAAGKRIGMIDIARFYGMVLVFYGHFIERIMYLKNPAAAAQYKFIYSFHMMLFFVLAGYIFKQSEMQFGFGKFLKHRFVSRLLPFMFFTLLFMVPPAFFSGEFFNLKLPSLEGYIRGLVATAFGMPMFCVPSWFILMLFSVEMVHYAASRFLKSDAKILIGAVVFYAAGYWLNLKFDIFNPMKQRVAGWNYLFIHEAITMYAFYLLGVYLSRKKDFIEQASLLIAVPGAVFTLLIVYFTYSLNNGPFNFNFYNSVVILFSSHGNFIWFPITAVAGCLLVLFLARITPAQKIMVWLGQNTLILMCLNGIFYHYINARAANWVVETLSGSGWTILGVGGLMTAASLAVCIPFVYIFNKFVPQLVGKPKIKGPWLKNLL